MKERHQSFSAKLTFMIFLMAFIAVVLYWYKQGNIFKQPSKIKDSDNSFQIKPTIHLYPNKWKYADNLQ